MTLGKLSFDPSACYYDLDRSAQFGNGDGVVVCGSPGEIQSDYRHGVINGFDMKTKNDGVNREIYKDASFTTQKYHLWWHLALNAKDQLRQRLGK